MIRVGLTGGIAAGKSVVARRLKELGAAVIDHDVLARDAVAVGTVGLEAIVARFGAEVVSAEGALDRPALGHLVFGDPQALRDLNGIVHPEVYRLAREREAAVVASGEHSVVVHDIPLLIETGQSGDFHVLVVVHAPADLRITRLVEGRGLALPEARRRVAAQIDDPARLAVADVVLDGAGTKEHLRDQVDEWWPSLQDAAD